MDTEFDNKVIRLIGNAVPGKFKKTKIARETHLQKELGLDSIGVLSLVFQFEEEFSVDIASLDINLDIAKLKTAGDLMDAGREIMNKISVKS
jgi:acyl carrier protein